MTNLDNLYKEMILEHNKKPRNFKAVNPHSHYSHGHNPLCGDDYIITLQLNGNIIEDIGFTGNGCAISKASGSLMTQACIGQTVEAVLATKELFLKSITQDEVDTTDLGKLNVFKGVKKYPVRVKCAALVWRALENALENPGGDHQITTE